jgi:hypothetical protein
MSLTTPKADVNLSRELTGMFTIPILRRFPA